MGLERNALDERDAAQALVLTQLEVQIVQHQAEKPAEAVQRDAQVGGVEHSKAQELQRARAQRA
ncbi:MAG: hypothetical protein BWZ09_00322 [Alphaproteobacteria bacterium ADurb.BinA305]|nr:MAG: hypothetical protein BWZ09_00322 [Alphaproteobacteria bacterium ADurb.BinA305]